MTAVPATDATSVLPEPKGGFAWPAAAAGLCAFLFVNWTELGNLAGTLAALGGALVTLLSL